MRISHYRWRIPNPILLGRDGWLRIVPVKIPNEARKTHLYTIGRSGYGKSKFLQHLITQDILAGRGVCVIDPHYDLIRDVMLDLLDAGHFKDQNNFNKVVYFEPTRTDYTIPFNYLNIDRPSHKHADIIIEVFKRAWPKNLEGAPRFKDIGKPSLRVLKETGQTLVDWREFLRNRGYRDQLLNRLQKTNPELVHSFRKDFDTAMSKDKEFLMNSESVANKLTDFEYDPDVKRCLGHAESRINFKDFMDKSKVLFVNLNGCSPEIKPLFASLISMGFEMAAFERGEGRTPFYLYLDEFQSYCANEGSSETLANVLSQCRKYGLRLHLANQTLGQLSQTVIDALENVGIKVAFSTGVSDGKQLAYHFWIPDKERIEVTLKAGRLHRSMHQKALVKLDGWELIEMYTERMKKPKATLEELEALKLALLQKHGVKVLGTGERPILVGGEQVYF